MMRKVVTSQARTLRAPILAPAGAKRTRTWAAFSLTAHQPATQRRGDVLSVHTVVARGLATTASSPIVFTTLVELQTKSCQHFASKNCLGVRSGKGEKYDWITYTEFGQRVERMRNVLKHHGVGKGDKVSFVACVICPEALV